MSHIDSSHPDPVARPDERATSSDRLARAGLVLSLAMILGVGAYALAGRSALEPRFAEVEQRASDALTAEMRTLRQENAALKADISTFSERLSATTQELENTHATTESLQRAHSRTARTAAANVDAVKAARVEAASAATRVTDVDTRVAGVSRDVASVAATLTTTRDDLASSRREMTAATTALSDRVARNADVLAELRRKGERDAIEFDIRKSSSPESWTVADVRIELRKADVRRSRYDVILHVDDRQFERRDRVANEPVAFLVGPEQARYELVVTAVERDRIRGYVSLPKDRGLSSERVASRP